MVPGTLTIGVTRSRGLERAARRSASFLFALVLLLASSPVLPAAAAPIAGSASRISEGVYSVYATREGLVGGTTSSGHRIAEHDYFVSLPSCTTTSCPGGAIRGNMTNCGARCYVKVINPRTNACRVEPIYDTGPWFRVDDWWNPTDQRYLNRLSSNPNTLVQGYTGSEAARNGLDVGYGIGPRGFGYDDTGTTPPRPWREVGNHAGIDLADGTWYDLRLASDGTGAAVTVHMLWQTGADPGAEARACGHPLNQKPPSNSPGAYNPSFAGTKAPIVYSGDSPYTGTSFASYDTNLNTTWFSGRDYKPRASLTVDLGATYDLTGIKWKFHSLGYADQFTVSAVNASGGSRTLGLYGNAPHAQTFYGVGVSDYVLARYVVFTFTNVDNDASLGSISELEVWARSTAPPPSSGNSPGALNPAFPGYKAPIVYSGDNPYTGTSFGSYDNNLDTTWFSGRDYQPRASLTVDLGTTRDISGVKWKFHTLGFADQFSVSAVNESGGTRGLGIFGNTAYGQTFYGFGVSDSVLARYVVFEFTNVGNDASLGSISELEVWAKPPASSSPIPGSNPQFTGQPLTITNSFGTANANEARMAHDANPETSWQTTSGSPTQAILTVDVGSAQPLTGIRWMYRASGGADRMRLQISSDNVTWTQLVTTTNRAPMTWEGWKTTASARFVRLIFDNPNGAAVLGYVGEVEVWGNGTTFQSASLPLDATPTPDEPSATPPAITTPDTDEIHATPAHEASPVAEVPADDSAATPDSLASPVPQEHVPESMTPVEDEQSAATPIPAAPIDEGTSEIDPPAADPPEAEAGMGTPPSIEGGTGATGYIAFTDGEGAFCRTLPGSDGAVIALLPEGAAVELGGEAVDGWQPVICEDQPGYLFAEFLTTDPPAPTASIAPPEDETATVEARAEEDQPQPDATLAAEPTAVPIAAPTETPAAEPQLIERELVIVASADTSVTALEPDSPQAADAVASLPAGGEAGAVAVISFQVEGVAGGDVIEARLVLTGTGDSAGTGGELIALPGFLFDETSTTWNDVANAGGGNAGWVDWIEPGGETAIDVTGVVGDDGAVTFVIAGAPEQVVAIGSGEGGAPAYLVLTVEEWTDPAP